MKRLPMLLVYGCICSQAMATDYHFTGFGSIVGAQVLDGDGYVANYAAMGRYDDHFDIIPETRLGLQGQVIFTDALEVTAQITTRGSLDWEPKLEWFYLGYELSDSSKIQVGRMRVPAYLYSDYMDVGYAYTFIRVPGDAYSVDVVNYNGANITIQNSFGSVDTTVQFYAGREIQKPAVLMSYIRRFEHDRDYTDMYGALFSISYGASTLRTSYLQTNITEIADPGVVPVFVPILATLADGRVITGDESITFYDVALLFDLAPVNLVLEYNEYEYYESWLASISYNSGAWTTHLSASAFDLDEPWEHHTSYALGVRYDVASGVALKAQIDLFDDTGENPFSLQPNTICHCEDGDVSVLSIGADFVF